MYGEQGLSAPGRVSRGRLEAKPRYSAPNEPPLHGVAPPEEQRNKDGDVFYYRYMGGGTYSLPDNPKK